MHCGNMCTLLGLCLLMAMECKVAAGDSTDAAASGENTHQEILRQISRIEDRLIQMETSSKRLEVSVDELKSEAGYDCWSLENYVKDLTADQALITGPVHSVPDTALTSSSNWDGRDDHGPRCSRLDAPKPAFCSSNSWLRGGSDVNGWIQVDLGRTFEVTGVVTRGRGAYSESHQFVKSYKMATFHPENQSVQYYQRGQILTGNADKLMSVMNELNPPLVGRYIRLYPVSYNAYASLRWELYGHPHFDN